jgi:hypothetical protein
MPIVIHLSDSSGRGTSAGFELAVRADGRAPKTALRALGSLILLLLKQRLGVVLHQRKVSSYRLLPCWSCFLSSSSGLQSQQTTSPPLSPSAGRPSWSICSGTGGTSTSEDVAPQAGSIRVFDCPEHRPTQRTVDAQIRGIHMGERRPLCKSLGPHHSERANPLLMSRRNLAYFDEIGPSASLFQLFDLGFQDRKSWEDLYLLAQGSDIGPDLVLI